MRHEKLAGISVLYLLASFVLAGAANAMTVPLSVEVRGNAAGVTSMASITNPDGVVNPDDTFSTGGILSNNSFEVVWEATGDLDPVVSNPISVTNLLGVPQDFTVMVTLPVAPFGPATLTGGSVSGSVTSNGVSMATLSSIPGTAMYQALIDGGTFMTLLNDPQSVSANAGLSATLGPADFGTPIPSLVGPAVASSIGIELNFRLSAGDSAGFTSVFVAEPVPEPATCVLLGLGALGVVGAVARRRMAS